jgi:type IX secretion system PorP/SprF family membrane protein
LNKKSTYLLFLFTILAGILRAQVAPLADQYLMNPLLTNPALTGTSSKGSLTILARQQWLGITGAPTWQSATYHTSLKTARDYYNPRGFVNKGDNAFGRVGMGGGLFNIRYGAISQQGVHLNYGYHVATANGRLSFGLAPMFQQFVINKSDFIPPDGSTPDPLLDRNGREVINIFDAGAGIHYSSNLLFAGFSVTQMFDSRVSFGDLSFAMEGQLADNSWLARSLYVYGGGTIAFSKNFEMEPSAIVRYNEENGIGFQVNLTATFNKNLTAGLLYHFRESAGFFAGLHYNDLIVRYQFEAPFGAAVQSRFTTHQILLGYQF